MSTVRPTPAMVAALTARQLTDVLNSLRGKTEANPKLYGRQTQALSRAERAIFDKRFQEAREILGGVQAGIVERDQAEQDRAASAEHEALGDARGTPTARTETGVATRDGFLWLVNRKRYTQARVEAGRLFREKYAKAIGGSVRSCLNDTVGGGGDASPTAAQIHAKFEVEGVRRHLRGAVGESSGEAIYSLLEAVCGRGETVRQLASGEDRKADALAVELGFALDMAGVYLGTVRV